MNKIFQIIVGALTTVIVIAFASCQDEDEGKQTPEYEWPSKHFNQSYILPDSLSNLAWDIVTKERDSIAMGFCFEGESVYSGECPTNPHSPHPLYDSLVRMYHDTTWRGTTNYRYPPVAYPVSAISVVSDADFDDTHHAGSELIDIACVDVLSRGDFVLNGYPYDEEHFKSIRQPFSKFTQNERCLWCGAVGIHLPLPTLSRTHNLTVTFSFEGWRSVSSTVHVEL